MRAFAREDPQEDRRMYRKGYSAGTHLLSNGQGPTSVSEGTRPTRPCETVDILSSTLAKHQLLTLDYLETVASANRIAVPSLTEVSFELIAKGILDILKLSIQFDAAWLLRFDRHSRSIRNIFLYRFNQKAFSRYLDSFYGSSPVPCLRQIEQDGYVSRKGADLVDWEAWLEHPLYQEIIRPLGLSTFIVAVCFDETKTPIGLMILWRSEDRRDFSSRDVAFLTKASLPCALLLKRSPEIGGGERPKDPSIGPSPEPAVIVMGSQAKILYANQEAKNLLAILRSGKNQCPRTDAATFMRILRNIRTRVIENALLNRPEQVCPCELPTFWGTVFCCRGLSLETCMRGQNLVVILIESLHPSIEGSRALNPALPKFTAREDAVVQRLGLGFTNKEIASQLGIGVHTVKDHVKKIMKKLGTNTRAGIAGMIVGRIPVE